MRVAPQAFSLVRGVREDGSILFLVSLYLLTSPQKKTRRGFLLLLLLRVLFVFGFQFFFLTLCVRYSAVRINARCVSASAVYIFCAGLFFSHPTSSTLRPPLDSEPSFVFGSQFLRRRLFLIIFRLRPRNSVQSDSCECVQCAHIVVNKRKKRNQIFKK